MNRSILDMNKEDIQLDCLPDFDVRNRHGEFNGKTDEQIIEIYIDEAQAAESEMEDAASILATEEAEERDHNGGY